MALCVYVHIQECINGQPFPALLSAVHNGRNVNKDFQTQKFRTAKRHKYELFTLPECPGPLRQTITFPLISLELWRKSTSDMAVILVLKNILTAALVCEKASHAVVRSAEKNSIQVSS